MIIRKAEKEDVEKIVPLYEMARVYMRSRGNMTQWAGEYPDGTDVLYHIGRDEFYVGINDAGEPCLAFALILGNDPTYEYIENGSWVDNSPYGTVHMLASDMKEHNGFEACVDFCRGVIPHIRMDTHKDNKTMLRKLSAYGFRHCGVIYVADGTPREAFELCE